MASAAGGTASICASTTLASAPTIVQRVPTRGGSGGVARGEISIGGEISILGGSGSAADGSAGGRRTGAGARPCGSHGRAPGAGAVPPAAPDPVPGAAV